MEALGLVPSRNEGLEERRVHGVVSSVNQMLSLAFLGRSVRMGHLKVYTMGGKNDREELSNSRPLSHQVALMVQPN